MTKHQELRKFSDINVWETDIVYSTLLNQRWWWSKWWDYNSYYYSLVRYFFLTFYYYFQYIKERLGLKIDSDVEIAIKRKKAAISKQKDNI